MADISTVQFQTHFENNELRLCHTSCKILDAGLLVDLLRRLRVWLANHPNEVVSVLMGNDNFIEVENYTAPIVNSGLIDYVYHPPAANLDLDTWPTLGDMIQNNSRVVVMLDYKANFTRVPYIVDEFLVMWETKFSPTDSTFPCTPERPPHQSDEIRRTKMMLMNHNLNQNFSIKGVEILVPYWAKLDITNADHGNGSVGDAARHCETAWFRSPNFLLVDYYKDGNYPGSVFAVAAEANGLMYAHSGSSHQLTAKVTDVVIVYLGSVLIFMLVWG